MSRVAKRRFILITEMSVLMGAVILLIVLLQGKSGEASEVKQVLDQPTNGGIGLQEKSRDSNPQRFYKEDELHKKEEGVIYLTFDDGPNHSTDEILDILDTYHAKATFFMLEPNMKRYKEEVKRMTEEGHALALHGVTHQKSMFYKSSASVVGEMNQAQKTLQTITGVHTNLIRTPYGSVPNMTPNYREAVRQNGFMMWDWNVDSKDWFYQDQRYVSQVLQQLQRLQSDQPAVVLLHERAATLQHLNQLLKCLTEKGYTFKALTETMDPVQFGSHA